MSTLDPTSPRTNGEAFEPIIVNLKSHTLPASQQRVAPAPAFEIVSLRDLVTNLAPEEIKKIAEILSEDTRLEKMRRQSISENLGLKDISHSMAENISEKLSSSFCPASQRSLKTIVDFYFGYMRAFPNPTETEPLAKLFEYMTDPNKNWNAFMAKDGNGQIIGACSGEIIEIENQPNPIKVAMNEHTWVDAESRQGGIGTRVVAAYEEYAQRLGACGCIVEVENGYLLTDDPRGLPSLDDDEQRKDERRKFWTGSAEGLGNSMDPFDRVGYWGRRGYNLICTGDPPTPISYTQISMDLGNVAPCRELAVTFKPFTDTFSITIPKETYIKILVGFQQTIDKDALLYPELIHTIEQIRETPDDKLFLVGLCDPMISEILERSKEGRENAEQKDLEYCRAKLKDPKITGREREILESCQEFLAV